MKNLMDWRKSTRFALFSFLLCLSSTSCTNKDYDLDSLENLIGIGGDELVIPSSSTDTLLLADILDVKEGDCIEVDHAGDYVFYRKGDEVSPAIPVIDKLTIYPKTFVGKELTFPFVQSSVSIPASQVISFDYEGQKTDEIIDIKKATVDRVGFTVNFKFSSEMAAAKKLDRITLAFPAYMKLDLGSSTASCSILGSTVTLTDVPTTATQTLKLNVTQLDFTQTDQSLGTLTIDGNQLKVNGLVTLAMEASGLPTNAKIGKITVEASADAMTVNSATGYFKPTINLNDFGKAEVGSVPEYLQDDEVVVDLANPQINLTIQNNMNIQGNITGVISAYKNGAVTKSITVDHIILHPNETASTTGTVTKACICRTASHVDGTDYYVRSDLSELIATIPDYVTFTGTVEADGSRLSTFALGAEADNKVNLNYEINAPLAFAEKAHIIYKDTVDGWNEDLKDYSLSKDAYVNVSATVENRIPAYLKITAKAVDVNKKILDDVNVDVTYGDGNASVKASTDGTTSASTPVNVKLTEATSGALSKVDGLMITADATTQSDGSQSVVGITLNSRNHCLVARDIVIKLVGKVITKL